MRRIAAIVEGHGEVEAVPILLRRIARSVSPNIVVDIPRPIRVGRYKIVRVGEVERAVELAARRAGMNGGILIVLDAEDDCPAEMGPKILARAETARPDRSVKVVFAKAEYEAWFLAAAGSIAGQCGMSDSTVPPREPETIRDAKGWLSQRMPAGQSYRPTRHQPALTAVFDLDSARAAPSFDKLWRDVSALLSALEED